MRVAIYARVSTDAQEARGTIGSQLALLRERVAGEGDELVAEYTDEGRSGAASNAAAAASIASIVPGVRAARQSASMLNVVWDSWQYQRGTRAPAGILRP